jgi:hypothetical protein
LIPAEQLSAIFACAVDMRLDVAGAAVVVESYDLPLPDGLAHEYVHRYQYMTEPAPFHHEG